MIPIFPKSKSTVSRPIFSVQSISMNSNDHYDNLKIDLKGEMRNGEIDSRDYTK